MSAIEAAMRSATAQVGHRQAHALYHLCNAVQATAWLHSVADSDYAPSAEFASSQILDNISLAVNSLGISAALVREMSDAIAEERGTLWRPIKA